LVYLENAVGRDAFDQFLRTYFDRHAFQSMSTESFLIYIDQELLTNSSLSLDDIKKWIYEPGLPDDAILPSSQSFDLIDKARSGWLAGEQAAERLDSSQWSVHEWLYFLNNMPESLTDAQLAELDHSFNFTQTRNNEIAHSWLLIAVRHRYQPAMERLENYLISIGRRKLIVPLYKLLSESDWGLKFASDVYTKARPGYHPLAQSTLDPLFK